MPAILGAPDTPIALRIAAILRASSRASRRHLDRSTCVRIAGDPFVADTACHVRLFVGAFEAGVGYSSRPMVLLHWMVLHGDRVWPIALAALILFGALLWAWRARRALRADARRRCESLGDPHSRVARFVEDTQVSLVGTIQFAGSPARRFEDETPVAAASAGDIDAPPLVSARAEDLILIVEDANVEIAGAVVVVVGSRETITPRRFAQVDATRWKPARGASSSAVRESSVSAGDRVIAKGLLRRRPHAGDLLGYREADAVWSLIAIPSRPDEVGSVKLAADGSVRLSAPVGRSIVAGAILGALAFAALIIVAPLPFLALRANAWRIGYYAVTPTYRDQAIVEYGAYLVESTKQKPFDPVVLDRLVALDPLDETWRFGNCPPVEVEGVCCSSAATLAEHGQWARSAEAVAPCGFERTRGEAAFALGDFAGAARFLGGGESAWPLGEVLVARSELLAGDVEGAARAVHQLPPRPNVEEKNEIVVLRCLADALDGHRGDGAATDRLKAKRSSNDECAALAGDLAHTYPTYANDRFILHYEGDSDLSFDTLVRKVAIAPAKERDYALEGSGDLLAAELWKDPTPSPAVLRLIGITNHSEEGRAMLRDWLRWGTVRHYASESLSTILGDLSARLTLAESLGDEALVAELRPRMEAFRTAFLRPETAVALAVVESVLYEVELRWPRAM